MGEFRVAAARIRQGTLSLYATSMRVRDLIAPGFYSVETLDPQDHDKGYQRLLNISRAKRLADYIVKGQDRRDAFLPTSVFLATDKNIPFDESTNTIVISPSAVGPFSVVDGQHRLEGLKLAAERDDRVLDFEVAVNIAIELSPIAQMCHFLIVNTTQKSVDKSVEQRIFARITSAISVEELPSLPRWISNIVERGEIDRALKLVDYIDHDESSPWYNRVKMANEVGKGTVKQNSFVKSVVKYVLAAANPLSALNDLEKEKKIFSNYWKAIAEVLDDGDADTLYKYNGVELFCRFSTPFFMKLQEDGNFTVNRMTSLLADCFDNIEGEYAGVGHPDFWRTGGTAGLLNSAALTAIFHALSRALHHAKTGGVLQI